MWSRSKSLINRTHFCGLTESGDSEAGQICKPSCAQSPCWGLPPPQPPLNLGLSETGGTINKNRDIAPSVYGPQGLWAIYFWPHQSSSETRQKNGMAPAWAADRTELFASARQAHHQGCSGRHRAATAVVHRAEHSPSWTRAHSKEGYHPCPNK